MEAIDPAANPAQVAASRMRRLLVLGGMIAAVGFLGAYFETFRTLPRVWTKSDYSHGFLIPPITLWLLWRQRAAFSLTEAAPSWWGALLLVPAALLQFIGLRGEVTTLQGASLILALAGLVWQLFGLRILKRVAFPLAFLVFMIPTLPWFLYALSFKLKMIAAGGAVAISRGLGVLVQRDGVDLLFPQGVLRVEGACSGLRSLVAMLALGALMGYLSNGAIWKRVALVLLTLPIAVFANILRVSALCIYAGLVSVSGAAGTFHEIGGYALFAVAFLLLSLGRRVLRC